MLEWVIHNVNIPVIYNSHGSTKIRIVNNAGLHLIHWLGWGLVGGTLFRNNEILTKYRLVFFKQRAMDVTRRIEFEDKLTFKHGINQSRRSMEGTGIHFVQQSGKSGPCSKWRLSTR